jgi:acetoin utilization protein AcuB
MARSVCDCMSPNPWTVHADDSVEQAARIMRAHPIRHLPVLEGGTVVGVLDEDSMHCAMTFATPGRAVRVRDAMTRDPIVVDVQSDLVATARAMADRHHDSAIVMAHGKVVGVLCAFDTLRALASHRVERADVAAGR